MLKQPTNGEAHADPPPWPARVRDLAVRINNPDLSDPANLTAPISVEALLDTLTALYDDCRVWCEAGGSERLSGNVGTFNKRCSYGPAFPSLPCCTCRNGNHKNISDRYCLMHACLKSRFLYNWDVFIDGDVVEKIKLLRLNKDDFETIKPLAKGQFGTVSF